MSGRSRRGGHEEAGHGGQWKVAYADFVTAMMAFFLIMWLVSSATETQRAVIAKYFSTTSLIDLPAGNGVLNGGKSMIDQATQKSERLTPKGRSGDPHARDNTQTAPAPDTHAVQDRLERQRFEALKAELERMMRQGELRDLANNLSIEMTSEGLRIQIFDRDGESMFAPGSADPTSRLSRILMVISQVLQTVQNKVILAGHTDGQVMQRGLLRTGNCPPTAPMRCADSSKPMVCHPIARCASKAAPRWTCCCRRHPPTRATAASPSQCCAAKLKLLRKTNRRHNVTMTRRLRIP